MHETDLTAAEIADRLNQEGFHPTGRRKLFCAMTVRHLLSRWQLTGERYDQVVLRPDEWWLSDLARKLSVSLGTMRRWIAQGWMDCRRTPRLNYHLVWADADELARLRRLRDYGRRYPRIATPPELTTPKRRPSEAESSKNGKAKSHRANKR